MEHIAARPTITKLQNAPLCLALHDRINQPQRRLQRCAVVIIVKEGGVQVHRVDRVKLGDVDEIDAYQLLGNHGNLAARIFVSHCVDGIDFILVVKVGVKGVHDHHKLACWRTPYFGVNDKGSIHSLVDMALEWSGMAVIEVAAKGFCIELIGEGRADGNFARANAGDTIHFRRVKAMKVHRVGMSARVDKVDADAVAYLAIGTWLDALEFAAELPAFWQGVPMVLLIALITLGVLLVVGARDNNVTRSPLQIAYLIALGIGLHNLGEGLAIGAAYALGEAALGTFLVLGFTLHNITEGVGIAAPIVRERPAFTHFVLLALLAGGPAIVGTWIGGFAFNPVWATIFLAVGIGAILQVIWEVGKLMMRDSERADEPLFNWVNLSGVVVGVALMYFTAFLVKF